MNFNCEKRVHSFIVPKENSKIIMFSCWVWTPILSLPGSSLRIRWNPRVSTRVQSRILSRVHASRPNNRYTQIQEVRAPGPNGRTETRWRRREWRRRLISASWARIISKISWKLFLLQRFKHKQRYHKISCKKNIQKTKVRTRVTVRRKQFYPLKNWVFSPNSM